MSKPENNRWATLRQEPGPDLKLFRARFDHMQNPRNGKTEKMIILEGQDSANVVALTDEQELLFVRQYRFGIGDFTLELPGGLVDRGEGPEQAARRELREETGAVAEQWRPLGRIASNPVFMDNYIHHWLATGAKLEARQQLDEGEAIEIVFLPKKEVKAMLLRGEFQHPHTVNALLLFFHQNGQI